MKNYGIKWRGIKGNLEKINRLESITLVVSNRKFMILRDRIENYSNY